MQVNVSNDPQKKSLNQLQQLLILKRTLFTEPAITFFLISLIPNIIVIILWIKFSKFEYGLLYIELIPIFIIGLNVFTVILYFIYKRFRQIDPKILRIPFILVFIINQLVAGLPFTLGILYSGIEYQYTYALFNPKIELVSSELSQFDSDRDIWVYKFELNVINNTFREYKDIRMNVKLGFFDNSSKNDIYEGTTLGLTNLVIKPGINRIKSEIALDGDTTVLNSSLDEGKRQDLKLQIEFISLKDEAPIRDSILINPAKDLNQLFEEFYNAKKLQVLEKQVTDKQNISSLIATNKDTQFNDKNIASVISDRYPLNDPNPNLAILFDYTNDEIGLKQIKDNITLTVDFVKSVNINNVGIKLGPECKSFDCYKWEVRGINDSSTYLLIPYTTINSNNENIMWPVNNKETKFKTIQFVINSSETQPYLDIHKLKFEYQ